MADLSDVETALQLLIAGWTYPNGTSQPSAASGIPVKIVRGWPDSADLDEYLKANIAYISIYSAPGAERLSTRYTRAWEEVAISAPAGEGTIQRELRRQERQFQVTCWCSTPEQRDTLANFVDGKFAGAGDQNGLEFITLPDTTRARLKYVRTLPTDKDELSGAFRRDLIYSVEYATTETTTATRITAFAVALSQEA